MKTLSANALTEIAKQYATQPINIVEIEWETGSSTIYADKDLDIAEGKILALSSIQSSLSASNLQINQVSLTLDDTDGTIKSNIDRFDIHKKKATIYQYYGDLSTSDKFTVFIGSISTPFQWTEGDRQITFNITTNVETFEVGFSPEEGQLDFVSDAAVGIPWPLVFGDVVHSPTTHVNPNNEAVTLEQFGIVDPLLYHKLANLEIAYQYEAFMLKFWILVMRGANTIARDVDDLITAYINAIKAERTLAANFRQKITEIDDLRRDLQIAGADDIFSSFETAIRNAESDLENIAQAAQTLKTSKEELEEEIKLTKFEFDAKKKAATEQIKTWNNLRDIHIDYNEVEREIARQKKFVKATVQCENTQDFEVDTPVEVMINNVCWNVQFNSDGLMTLLAGPLLSSVTATVDTWAPDDDENMTGDYNLFRIQENPAPSLEGQWMLVNKVGAGKHLIYIERQDNQKLYFKLVEWDQSGTSSDSQPRGQSLDNLLKDIVDTPFVPNKFGSPIPASYYTGNADPGIWNRPESQVLLSILAITGPLTKEELELMTLLAYLLPNDSLGDSVYVVPPDPRDVYTIIGEDISQIHEIAGFIPEHWLSQIAVYEEVPDEAGWQAEAGSSVRDKTKTCEIYIANILPSTIKAVYAYRTNEYNETVLQAVPSRYYTKKESENLGTIDVTALVLPRKLSDIRGEGWSDEIYVTLSSSIGPNVVDVIQHLIETYIENGQVNAANFASVKTKVDNYPVNFTLTDRPDALAEIQQIAYEARLGLTTRDGEFFLKYLSEEPSTDTTLSSTTNLEFSLAIDYTRTEELVTVLEASFKRNYLPLRQGKRDPRVVLRSNVKKYGYHKQNMFFHIYNDLELVRKSATFWLIRKSNTWKNVQVKTVQSEIDVDTLDTVLLQSSFVADADVKCVVESVIYDPNDNEVIFNLRTPVRSGEMAKYDFFWPSSLASNVEYPPVDEVEFAGAYGPGSGVTGTIDC